MLHNTNYITLKKKVKIKEKLRIKNLGRKAKLKKLIPEMKDGKNV